MTIHPNCTKAVATEILEAYDLDWTSPAIDIYDALAEAGWKNNEIEYAIEKWLA